MRKPTIRDLRSWIIKQGIQATTEIWKEVNNECTYCGFVMESNCYRLYVDPLYRVRVVLK
jgi:hypothetical protein